MAPRAARRGLAAVILAVVVGAVLFAGAGLVGANGEQPPPGTVSDAPVSPQPDIPQPPPGAVSDTPVSPQPTVAQPANPSPDGEGAPTQVAGPEEPAGPATAGAESGRVDTGGVDGADQPGGRTDG